MKERCENISPFACRCVKLWEDVKSSFVATATSYITAYKTFSTGLEGYINSLSKKSTNLSDHESVFSQLGVVLMSYASSIAQINGDVDKLKALRTSIEVMDMDSIWEGPAHDKQKVNFKWIPFGKRRLHRHKQIP